MTQLVLTTLASVAAGVAVSKLTAPDTSAADTAAKAAGMEKNRVRRQEAETSGLLAAAKNAGSRPDFLSGAGYRGLRRTLGGNRS